jgi:DNA-binding protein Fis
VEVDSEAEQIRCVVAATTGNKSRAAKILGINRKTPWASSNLTVFL